MTAGSRERPDISVIIPAVDEEASVVGAVDSARAPGVEVLVVDGGSRDATRARAASAGAAVIEAPRGRARQMNAGARAAGGPTLLFLHADTLLPDGWAAHVRGIAAGGAGVPAGWDLVAIGTPSQ